MHRPPLPTLALLLALAALPGCRPAEAPPEEADAAPEGTEATDATVFESGFEEGALDDWDAGDPGEGGSDETTEGGATIPAEEAESAAEPPATGD